MFTLEGRADLSRDALEEFEHSQRIEILLSLLDVGLDRAVEGDGRIEGRDELVVLYLHLLRPEFLVDDLERPNLLHDPVDGAAVRAVDDLAAGDVDGLRGRLALQVLEVRPAEAAKERSSVVLVQHDVSAGLGNA